MGGVGLGVAAWTAWGAPTETSVSNDKAKRSQRDMEKGPPLGRRNEKLRSGRGFVSSSRGPLRSLLSQARLGPANSAQDAFMGRRAHALLAACRSTARPSS